MSVSRLRSLPNLITFRRAFLPSGFRLRAERGDHRATSRLARVCRLARIDGHDDDAPVSPLMADPLFDVLLDTSTPMYSGTVSGGAALLPGSVLHGTPHTAGGVVVGSVTSSAKPLNADGDAPPDSTLFADQL